METPSSVPFLCRGARPSMCFIWWRKENILKLLGNSDGRKNKMRNLIRQDVCQAQIACSKRLFLKMLRMGSGLLRNEFFLVFFFYCDFLCYFVFLILLVSLNVMLMRTQHLLFSSIVNTSLKNLKKVPNIIILRCIFKVNLIIILPQHPFLSQTLRYERFGEVVFLGDIRLLFKQCRRYMYKRNSSSRVIRATKWVNQVITDHRIPL